VKVEDSKMNGTYNKLLPYCFLITKKFIAKSAKKIHWLVVLVVIVFNVKTDTTTEGIINTCNT